MSPAAARPQPDALSDLEREVLDILWTAGEARC
jgi:predicted transcriptional regulator